MKKSILATFCLGLSIVSGFSWGEEGHQAIADAAFNRLNAQAKSAVQNILSHSSVHEINSIHSAATWPDDIRLSKHPGKFAKTAGGKSFNKRFSGNRVWHFVDYPLDGTYSANGPFSSPTDVVHIIGHCIDVLEHTAQTPWSKMKKEEALAWLIHLAGDIHQPLHVGVGFFDFVGDEAFLVTDPAKASGKFTDLGGNSLHFGSSNFHSFWDGDMVSSISTKEPTVVAAIATAISASSFANHGNHHDWAEAWATDTLKAAKEAYAGITDSNNSVGQREAAHPQIIDIDIVTKDYKAHFDDLVMEQLAQAAFDLADLLNNINWP